METIGNLLLKYKIPGVVHAEIRRICREEITCLTGVPLTAKQVVYKNEELFLGVPSVLKSSLLLTQQDLFKRLADRGVTIKKIS